MVSSKLRVDLLLPLTILERDMMVVDYLIAFNGNT